MRVLRSFATLALSSLFAALATAEGVHNLSTPGATPAYDLQAALDAALDGDVLLLAGGVYDGFTLDGKGVHLYAATGQVVQVHGTVRIAHVPSASSVVLSGLVFVGPDNVDELPAVSPALALDSCDGHVRLDGCTVLGGDGIDDPQVVGWPGEDALVVQSCAQVLVVASSLVGGNGSQHPFDCCAAGGDGGAGLRATASPLALYDSQVLGGDGGQNGTAGGSGAPGLLASQADVIASGALFVGGDGGDGTDFIVTSGGDGGDGLALLGNQRAYLFDCALQGGALGRSLLPGAGPDGVAGKPYTGVAPPVTWLGPARCLGVSAVRADDVTVRLQLEGEPGDKVWAHFGDKLDFAPYGAAPRGVLALSPRVTLPVTVLPASGTATVLFTLPSAALLGADATSIVQLEVISPAGTRELGAPRHVLTLPRAGGADCDGSTVNDLLEAIDGTVPDCGPNLVPDACDADCDLNGVPDDCDIAGGLAQDCDGNGVPDACDVASGGAADCDGNGVPDACQIAANDALDANLNGVLDACEGPSTIWVDPAAPAGGNGSTGAPFADVTSAMAAAISGDTIVLRDGVYTGAANRDVDFGTRELVLRSENGPANCVFDLASQGPALKLWNGEQSRATRIQGITFRNALVTSGAGVIDVAYTSPRITDCRFLNCSSNWGPGALQLASSGARVELCEFVDCSSTNTVGFGLFGGAITATTGPTTPSVEIAGCSFLSCDSNVGGAVVGDARDMPVVLSHCRFEGCSALERGGAVYLSSSTGSIAYVTNCLFQGNTAGVRGGALYSTVSYLPQVSQTQINGCTFHANSSVTGGAVSHFGPGEVYVLNSILWDDAATSGGELSCQGHAAYPAPTLTVAHADLFGGVAGLHLVNANVSTNAVLAVDPQFAAPLGLDGLLGTYGDNDLRPLAGAPVNDSGLNSLIALDLVDADLDGNTAERNPLDLDLTPRRKDDALAPDAATGTPPLVDMGCYEHP
ncbi:MAG: hypothetical protein H6828_13010 [Planctomycetes bacterium]|nr:hypothetical protein [Planctomycetota bacterium]